MKRLLVVLATLCLLLACGDTDEETTVTDGKVWSEASIDAGVADTVVVPDPDQGSDSVAKEEAGTAETD